MFVRGYFFVSIWKLYGILKEYRNGTQEYEAISQQRIYRIWLQFLRSQYEKWFYVRFSEKLRRDEKANKTAVQYMDKNFLHQNNFCSPGAYCVKQEEHTDAERSAVFKA